MKKLASIVLTTVLYSSIQVFSGCGSVDTVTPPPSTPGGAGTPATVQVTLTAGTIANGGSTTATAVVRDASSVVVPNVTVSFSVISSGAGNFNPASAVTDAAGVATSLFTAVTPNTNATIRATVTVGLSTISGSALITIGAPPQVPTTVVIALGATTIANSGNTSVSATVRDALGAVISGATVTFSASNPAAGNFTPAATATTNGSGVATVTFTAVAAGNNSFVDISATAGTVSNSVSLSIGSPPPPVPVSMALTINPLTMSISSSAVVAVTLLDSTGSPAYNNAVTLTITFGATLASFSSSTLVSSVTVTTNSSGTASATIYSGANSGAVTVKATSGLLLQSASLSITSSPASISVTAVNPNLINGQSTNITADVRNVLNNAVSDGTMVTFSITAGATNAGQLSPLTATTVNGIASVTFAADASNTGSLIITASAGTSPAVTATVLIIVNSAQTGSLEFVSATPDVINISGAGASSSFVKFKVISSTGSPMQGVNVNFTLYGPTGATLDAGGLTTSSGSTDAQGEVTTILKAGNVAGPCRIAAAVTVTGPPVSTLSASSGNISIGGGVPSDRFFSTSVTKRNIDGLLCDNVQSRINVLIADRFGNYNILKGTSVSFATDAGAIDTSNITDATGATTSDFRSQAPRPTDVAPVVGEPSYTVGARTYNPRDGWLTILVSTTGEEYFQDDNANGVYDLSINEPFNDLPEPFIDSDDSGTRGSGELFFDWPSGVTGNTVGSYNGVNGVWDAKIPIFREVNLVMTGPPNIGANTTRIVNSALGTGAVTIARGSSETFYVYVSDVNMNALIAGTKIAATSSKSEAVVAFVGGSETLADALSTGPAIVAYTVTNNNTSSPAVSVLPSLSATIDWPGTCGTVKVTISYPGSITLP